MKKILTCVLCLCCLCLITICHAQITDTALLSVKYTFYHMQDTSQPGKIHEENMILYVGRNASFYRSLDKMEAEAERKAGFEEGSRLAGKVPNMVGVRFVPTVSFYKDFGTRSLTNVEVTAGKEYLYSEPLETMDWKISSETKTLLGILCQKATGVFRGRTYTAWFTSQFPYNNGPWKLGGLPGLIVEASDQKKEVVFAFAGFATLEGGSVRIELAKDGITTTAAELKKLKEALETNPDAIRGSGKSGNVMMETNGRPVKAPAGNKQVINNPIEKNF